MKRIILFSIVIIVGFFFFMKSGVPGKMSGILEPDITISDLKKSSIFTDSLIELRNFYIIETQSILNYSRSKVTDETGEEMYLLSSRPFRKNERVTSLKGRYMSIYADNERRYDVFIAADLKVIGDLLQTFKNSLLP